MYAITTKRFDYPYNKLTSITTHEKEFPYKDEALSVMMQMLINDTAELNQPTAKLGPRPPVAIPQLKTHYQEKSYDGAIVVCDGPEGFKGLPMALYQVEWKNTSPVDEVNWRLKEYYGESLTLWIRSEMVDDEDSEDGKMIEKYYFEGSTCSKDELYDTPKEAYDAAVDYMELLLLCAD